MSSMLAGHVVADDAQLQDERPRDFDVAVNNQQHAAKASDYVLELRISMRIGPQSGRVRSMANNYSSDGTYWTGRERQNGLLEVLRINSTTGDYSVVESWGSYHKHGSAVSAAAQLAYLQGRSDAIEEMRGRVHAALDGVGLGAAAVLQPDEDPDAQL